MTRCHDMKRQVLLEAVDHVRGMADSTHEMTAPKRPDGWDDPDSPTGNEWRRACREIAHDIMALAKGTVTDNADWMQRAIKRCSETHPDLPRSRVPCDACKRSMPVRTEPTPPSREDYALSDEVPEAK